MLPSIWNGNDNMFDLFSPFSIIERPRMFAGNFNRLMKTDVHEMDDHYELVIDLPGFNKEDITAHLEDGNLVISAEKKEEKSENDDKGKIIRQERFVGSMSRSFYVGDLKEEDIKAKFDNGVLKIEVPKKQEPEQKPILIEG